jgi:hypothetical protein
MSYDKNTDTYSATPLKEVIITAKKQYEYKGCVAGLCNKLAEENNMNTEDFRKLNNLYGNAWDINNNSYGQNIDISNYENLQKGDIINLSRDKFETDVENMIPNKNQHIGYISKIENGIPYVKHYISNVGTKLDGKTMYGEYFEEPINNIKEKFKYTATGGRRIDFYKNIDKQPSNFKYDDNYEPNDIEKDFAALHKDKENIQDKLKLTSSEYDDLAKISYGIMGNESSFGRSSKTLYRMATPDFIQKIVKQGDDLLRNKNTYDDNINNLSQGYSSTKESSLHGVNSNDNNKDYKELNKKIKDGEYEGLERTNNYLYSAFKQLNINPDNLENGANSGKAIIATLAWYKKRNPNATTEDLLKMYTGKKDITNYKKSFDEYQKNINNNSEDNKTYNWKQNLYGKLSNLSNNTYKTTKEINSFIVSTIRDYSPLPTQYNALISDVLQGKKQITEKTLSSSNIEKLKEIVKNNVNKNKFNIEYDDYGSNSDIGQGTQSKLESIKKSFTDDAYILQTLLGQASIKKIDNDTYEIIDTYDFNDSGKSFGIFDDLRKRGISPYNIARSVGRNYGSIDKQGANVKIKIKLK